MRNVFLQLVYTKSNTYSSYGDTTAFTDQTNQIGACFVLNEYSDDPDTSANMVGQHVPLPTETTEQVPLTPTASAAVDTKDAATLNVSVMDDDDETWGDRSRTQDRMEQNVQVRNVSWFAELNCFVSLSETSCITDQSKERSHDHARVLLFGHKDIPGQRNSTHRRTQDRWAGICWYVSRWM